MTTEIADETQANEGAESFDDKGPRDHLKNVEAENKDLRKQVLTGHIEAIGLNTKEGLGVAVFEGYKGEFTEEAVAAFAKEKYGHEFDEGEPVAEVAEELEAKEAAKAAVTESSQPVTPVSQLSHIQEADNAMTDPELTAEQGITLAKGNIQRKLEGFMDSQYPNR